MRSNPFRRRGWPGTLTALWLSRLLMWGGGVAALSAFGSAPPGGIDPPGLLSGYGAFADRLVAPVARWDAAWYLLIARHGYQPHGGAPTALRAVFFPVYPLLVRGLSQLGIPLLAAGVLISLAALAWSLEGLGRLIELERGDAEAARLGRWALALSPMAVFLSAVYTDALFIALSVAAILCARRGRWGRSALAVAIASATRNTGLLLALPVTLLYLYGPREDRAPDVAVAPRWRPRYTVRRDAAWLALAPAGLLAVLGYWQAVAGDALAPLHRERFFGHHFRIPPLGLWDGIAAAAHDGGQILAGKTAIGLFATGTDASVLTGWQNLLPLLLLVLSVPLIVGVVRELPVAYGAYVVVGLLVPIASPTLTRPLQGLPRYETMLFPLFVYAGVWLARHPRLRTPALAASAALAALLAAEFATWHFVA